MGSLHAGGRPVARSEPLPGGVERVRLPRSPRRPWAAASTSCKADAAGELAQPQWLPQAGAMAARAGKSPSAWKACSPARCPTARLRGWSRPPAWVSGWTAVTPVVWILQCPTEQCLRSRGARKWPSAAADGAEASGAALASRSMVSIPVRAALNHSSLPAARGRPHGRPPARAARVVGCFDGAAEAALPAGKQHLRPRQYHLHRQNSRCIGRPAMATPRSVGARSGDLERLGCSCRARSLRTWPAKGKPEAGGLRAGSLQG